MPHRGGGFGHGGFGRGGFGRGWGGGGRGFWGGPRFFGPRFGFGSLFRPFGWGYGWYGAPWGGMFLTETAMLFLMGAAAFKISQSDAERVRDYTGRDFGDLSEAEMAEAMRRLGIRQMELSDDERQLIVQNRRASAASESEPEKSKNADPANVIRELKRLRDEGILSEEEYQARKARALDNLTG